MSINHAMNDATARNLKWYATDARLCKGPRPKHVVSNTLVYFVAHNTVTQTIVLSGTQQSSHCGFHHNLIVIFSPWPVEARRTTWCGVCKIQGDHDCKCGLCNTWPKEWPKPLNPWNNGIPASKLTLTKILNRIALHLLIKGVQVEIRVCTESFVGNFVLLAKHRYIVKQICTTTRSHTSCQTIHSFTIPGDSSVDNWIKSWKGKPSRRGVHQKNNFWFPR